MNLALMSQGFDAIMIRESDRRAYNAALTEMFTTGSTVPYAQFLVDRYDVTCRRFRQVESSAPYPRAPRPRERQD
jgi:hypothetical protein